MGVLACNTQIFTTLVYVILLDLNRGLSVLWSGIGKGVKKNLNNFEEHDVYCPNLERCGI